MEPRACTLPRRLGVLHQTPFFARLPADAISEISRFFREKAFAAGQTIYTAGDTAVSLYVVAVGKVKLARMTETGKTVVLGVIGPGEFFGGLSALGDRAYADSAVAHTACCVLAVAGTDFQVILRRYPQVANAALEIVAARLASMHELVEQLSAHPAEQRIVSTLLALEAETQLDPELRTWLSFARQKLEEIALLARAAAGDRSPEIAEQFDANRRILSARTQSAGAPAIRRCEAVQPQSRRT